MKDVMAAKVTASAGVALDETPSTDIQRTVIASELAAARVRLNALDVRSERAATAAKKAGRNRAMVYTDDMANIVDER